MTTPTPDEICERLRALMSAATPGPYRAHDHTNMGRFNGNPDRWVGYAWVGRITKSSRPDGSFDAVWFRADRRNDSCKEYRERAAADAAFVAETLNALPTMLDLIQQQQATIERLSAALEESYSALRHVYEHGVKPRPQWVGEVFNKAYERARAALGEDAK